MGQVHFEVVPGRIVYYVLPVGCPCAGQVRPAVIVRVWTKELDIPDNPGMSNIQVFLDGGNDQPRAGIVCGGKGGGSGHRHDDGFRGSVIYDATGQPGTWHWPTDDITPTTSDPHP